MRAVIETTTLFRMRGRLRRDIFRGGTASAPTKCPLPGVAAATMAGPRCEVRQQKNVDKAERYIQLRQSPLPTLLTPPPIPSDEMGKKPEQLGVEVAA